MEATEKIYKCGHCGDTNDSLESLKQHMVSVHMPAQLPAATIHQQTPVASTSAPELMVIDAEQLQPNQLTVQQEPAKKSAPAKFKCGHCGLLVNGLDGLKEHMLSAHVKDSETAKELAKAAIPQKGKTA